MEDLSERIKHTLATPAYTADEHVDLKQRAQVLRQLWGMLIVLSILIFILFTGAVSIAKTQSNIGTAIADARAEALTLSLANRETGYKNRAVDCQALVAMGQILPPSCLEKEIVVYYDSTAKPQIPASAATETGVRRLCAIQKHLGIDDPTCPAS
jgi:hypothetical protein